MRNFSTALLLVLSTIIFSEVTAQVNIKNGLVVHYTLDGHAADSGANGLNGVMFGTTNTSDRFGKANAALKFNGSSDYIAVPHNSVLSLTGSKSVSVWYKLDDANLLNYPTIIYKQGDQVSNPNYSLQLAHEAGYGSNRYKLDYFHGNAGGNKNLFTKQDYRNYLGQWVHIIFSYNTADGYMRIYFNGQISDSLYAPSFVPYTSTDSMQIARGSKVNYPDSYFKGSLDDIRIYNRALHRAEVIALYNGVYYTYSTRNISICPGDSVLAGGQYRKTAGTYRDTIHVNPGHDSVVTNNLSIYQTYFTPLSRSVCQGDSLFLAGKYRTASGVYNDSLKTKNGCDSIISYIFTVNPEYLITRTVKICPGQKVFVAGALRDTAGMYAEALKTVAGCDSIVVTSVQLSLPFYTVHAIDLCAGESVLINGKNVSQSGLYFDSLKTTGGCDSIAIINLTVYPSYFLTQSVHLCTGESILINGKPISQPGIYNDSFKTVFGCDSIIQITLTNSSVGTAVVQIANALKALQDSAAYQWLDCNNSYLPISGATAQIYTATANGDYAVEVTKNGCVDTSVCYTVTGVGINNINFSQSVSMYPNPATGAVKIDLGQVYNNADIAVYSINGQKLIAKKINNSQTVELDIEGLTGGIYLVEIKTAGKYAVLKLVVE